MRMNPNLGIQYLLNNASVSQLTTMRQDTLLLHHTVDTLSNNESLRNTNASLRTAVSMENGAAKDKPFLCPKCPKRYTFQ